MLIIKKLFSKIMVSIKIESIFTTSKKKNLGQPVNRRPARASLNGPRAKRSKSKKSEFFWAKNITALTL